MCFPKYTLTELIHYQDSVMRKGDKEQLYPYQKNSSHSVIFVFFSLVFKNGISFLKLLDLNLAAAA